jgi:hypothetical protein
MGGRPLTRVEYLDLEDLLGLVRALKAGPVRDVGLLDLSSRTPDLSKDAAFDLVVDVAKGTLDVEEIAELLSLGVTD